VIHDQSETYIELEDKQLILPDTFFSHADKHWLSGVSVPQTVFRINVHIDKDYETLIIGDPSSEQNWIKFENISKLNIDIFGSLFFLISRYEELASDMRDEHDRFPSWEALLGKHGQLDRAIGNEYIELLWAALIAQWPHLIRPRREARILPSHDIDSPSAYWEQGVLSILKLGIKSFLYQRNVLRSVRQVVEGVCYPRLGWREDPFDTIDKIMTFSEAAGTVSSFFYIPEKTCHKMDLGMPIFHPQIEKQWERIAARGHNIGVHPGYNTYQDAELLNRCANSIRNQLKKMGIEQTEMGGRQHFLRWETSKTAVAWDQAGMDYDSTLGFADRSGFRCGVCYEFPLYDLLDRKPLKLRERPLILMECSVIDELYMGLGHGDESVNYMLKLKQECLRYGGDFTILWHNQRFIDPREIEIYKTLLGIS